MQRKNEGNMKEIQREYKGKRKYEGNMKEIQRKYERNMKEI